MSNSWPVKKLNSVDEVFDELMQLQGKGWLSRGQSRRYKTMKPCIDRKEFEGLSRIRKLKYERQSIDRFRSTARYFASVGEERAGIDDVITLAVLRHYGVPTRLLDWSASPYVAAYFAVSGHDHLDGEIWSFSEPDYAIEGKKQWRKWPLTTTDHSGDDDKFEAGLTAFSRGEPVEDWIIAVFYPEGFPRQNAQHGAYTMTARFDIDHANKLRELLIDESRFRRYVLKAELKKRIRRKLQRHQNICRGSLYPDSAGAAETVKLELAQKKP
jgi:FRG domain